MKVFRWIIVTLGVALFILLVGHFLRVIGIKIPGFNSPDPFFGGDRS